MLVSTTAAERKELDKERINTSKFVTLFYSYDSFFLAFLPKKNDQQE